MKRTMKQIARRLRRAPAFTIVAVITLGVSIGAHTAVFSVVEGDYLLLVSDSSWAGQIGW